jgi:peptide/nickel transport system substrate-binding protein
MAQDGDGLPPREETVWINVGTGKWNNFERFNSYVLGGGTWGAVTGFYQGCLDVLYIANHATGEVWYYLSSGWEYNEDFTSLTLYLRPEAKWSDGTPFTSADVNFTLYMLIDMREQTWWTQGMTLHNHLESTELPDDHTIILHMNQPMPRLHIDFMAKVVDGVMMAAKHVWGAEGVDPVAFDNNPPVTTGPYTLHQTFPDLSLFVWKRVEDWWGNDIFGKPGPKYMVWGQAASTEVLYEQMRNNEWDITTLSRDLQEKLKTENTYLQTHLFPGACPDIITPNCLLYPLNMSEMRWILSYSFPYHLVNPLNTQMYPMSIPDSPFVPGYGLLDLYVDPSILTRYGTIGVFDLNEAERRLDEIDFIDRNSDGVRETPNGTLLSFNFVTAGDPGSFPNTLWPEWQKELAKIGIELTIEYVPGPQNHERRTCGQFDIISYTLCGATIDPLNHWIRYHDTQLPEPDECFWNWAAFGRWNDPEFDALYDELITISPDPNDPEVVAKYHEMLDFWFKNIPEIPYIYKGQSNIFSTAYWEGWPTNDVMYTVPMRWWMHFSLIFFNLHTGSVGLEISFGKSLESVTEAMTQTVSALDETNNNVAQLEGKITSLEGTIAAATTNQNIAIAIAVIAIIIAVVGMFYKR